MSELANSGKGNVLVAGGAGYIGCHTVLVLLEAGFDITVVDNLVNSSEEGLNRVKELVGCDPSRVRFFNVNLCDKAATEVVFKQSPTFCACIHFAGLKAVGESVRLPLLYYENNLLSTVNLLNLLDQYGCRTVVFSSSATVYGSAAVPITEESPTGTGITNAYGRTKYMIEEILKDFKVSKDMEFKAAQEQGGAAAAAAQQWSVVTLRYFNPIGAHRSGRIGEDPNGPPNNLMPYVAQVAVGRREKLTVFGKDYDTPDGTGVRDYIHVVDLAEGHLAAINYAAAGPARGKGCGQYSVFNLGTGNGVSVLQMVAAMEKACGHSLAVEFGPRRAGDIATCYADPTLAERELGWRAKKGIDEACTDLWNWQSNNPNGYAK